MTDTFRALCAELVDAWLKGDDIVGAMNRARAALGEADEPAVPQGREPAAVTGRPRTTEDDVEDAAQCIYEAMRFERVETTPAWSELGNSLAQDTARKAARAVLAHWGNPAPTPPADGEVAELVAWLRMQGEAQKPGPKSLLSTKTKKEMHANGSRLIRAAELLQQMEDLAADAVAGLRYIEESCGRLYGVGWDRVYGKADRLKPAHALPLPEVSE